MNRQQILEYYGNEFILNQILGNSKDREIAGAFWDGSYDKRPNILQFPSDVVQMSKKGVTSFHYSVEHWHNAMSLTAENTQNYENLRKGWDILIDIDSKLGIDESKLAARLIIKKLEKYGIKNYGIKFSGRRGFHIVMPWIMFPKIVDYTPAEKMYPLIPSIISRFLRKKIRRKLMEGIVKSKGAKQLMEMMDEVPEKLSPYFFVEVEKNWGSRHMFRAPYSLNEKTWLASVPLSRNQFRTFSIETADPKYVIAHSNIYDTFFKGEENEAQDLVTEALDWYASIKKEEKPKPKKPRLTWDKKIDEQYFPPCIKNILSGMGDGRKRSVFTLVNFLRMMNWPWEEVESKIYEWNEKNRPPLPRSVIIGQLRWSQKNSRNPTNCPPDGDLFYRDSVNVCRPDKICMAGGSKIAIKNPIVYPFKIMKIQRSRPKFRGYSCGICNEQFKNQRSLTMHKSRVHSYTED